MTKTLVITPPFLESFRPPISGAIICAVAKSAGHDVTAWDPNIKLFNKVGGDKFYEMMLQFNGLQDIDSEDNKVVHEFLANYDYNGYDYILISVFSQYEIAGTKIVLEEIKRRGITSTIVLGGSGVELNYNLETDVKFGESMLKQGLCNYYVVGEGEVALTEIFKGNASYPGINGKAPSQIDNLDTLPFPNYDFYDRNEYDYIDPDMPDLFVYGSRGCVRRCTFCDVAHYWPLYRYRSGANIAEELLGYWEKYGIKHFFFTDSLVNGSLKAYRELHETLARKQGLPKLHISGYAIIRPKNQHPKELFDMMQNTGKHLWSIGVEHGSDAMRLDMKKKFTNEDIEWHLEQSERIGLQNNWLLMPTWVNEKLEHHQEYLDMFVRWRRYVANGVITSITIAPALAALKNTPIVDDHHADLRFYETENNVLREMLWMNDSNPELTIKERHRRTLEIYKQALRYKWPVNEAQRKLLAFESIVNSSVKLTSTGHLNTITKSGV